MNFRPHVQPERVVFQIAPMVDILLFLLVFFTDVEPFANEAELDCRYPRRARARKTDDQPEK